jgi:diphthamide synthase subunit DPH2
MKTKKHAVATTPDQLKKESQKTTDMLKGKIVDNVWRHRPTEIGIQFADGCRFFVDIQLEGLELSITGGHAEESENP